MPLFKTGLHQLLGYSVYNKDKVTFTSREGGNSHIKWMGVLVVPLRDLKSRIGTTAGVFAVPLRVLS